MRDGCIEDGCQVGSLLERSRLQMKEWGNHDEERSSVALKIEAIAISIAWTITVLVAIAGFVGFSSADAHPGGLAADGCHNDRKNGGRHCHRGPNAGQSTEPQSNGSVYYPNCAAARAAGAAPLYRGQPGYGRHLDRDDDGKACE
jgi:Excalibur calcium-binding domain